MDAGAPELTGSRPRRRQTPIPRGRHVFVLAGICTRCAKCISLHPAGTVGDCNAAAIREHQYWQRRMGRCSDLVVWETFGGSDYGCRICPVSGVFRSVLPVLTESIFNGRIIIIREVTASPAMSINVNAFIGYIEHLTSHISLNRAAFSSLPGDAALHNITLPQTWAIAVLARPSPTTASSLPTNLLLGAADSLLRALLQIESSDQYRFEGRPLSDFSTNFRILFATRV